MECFRCGSNDVELLPTEVPKGKEDYEQYFCNNCKFLWDTEDLVDFERDIY